MKKKEHQPKKKKKPWPTKDAMAQIYEMNLWGGVNKEFYSGEGSHDPDLVDPYIKAVATFLNSFDEPITVCDLGCGDFNVGKELVKHTKHYTAIDIVPALIQRNRERFRLKGLEFQCLNIAKDKLPSADCALVRQVLQHLSNKEVENILAKLAHFKYVILTEHLPEGEFEPNKDIISGQGTRLKIRSGLDVFSAPFNFKVKEKNQLASVILDDGRGIIKTSLYKVF